MFACKYYARIKFHGKVWWFKCKTFVNMSLLEIGLVMFGGAEKIFDYLRQHEVLVARNNSYTRLFSNT